MSEQNLKYTCCFCGLPFYGYGNNAEPVIKNGVCCDECNLKKVIPARMKLLKDAEIDQQTAENMNYVVNLFTNNK